MTAAERSLENMSPAAVVTTCLAVAALVAGCATSGSTSKVSVGMTKAQVVEAMGPPDSVSAQSSVEVMSYYLCYSNCIAIIPENRKYNWYYVRLMGGRVDAYGNNQAFGIQGDFDSSKVITTNSTLRQDINVQRSAVPAAAPGAAGAGGASNGAGVDIYSELKKLQELKEQGILTQEEFDARKKRLLAQ